MLSLTAQPAGARNDVFSYRVPVPEAWRGLWIRVKTNDHKSQLVVLRLLPEPNLGLKAKVAGGERRFITYVPPDATELELSLHSPEEIPNEVALQGEAISKSVAMMRLLGTAKKDRLINAIEGDAKGIPGRLRTEIVRSGTLHDLSLDYPSWIRLFDTWNSRRTGTLMDSLKGLKPPSLGAYVFHDDQTPPAALAATLESLKRSLVPIPILESLDPSTAPEYVALLEAGEVLDPISLAVAWSELASRNWPRVAYFDEDRLDGSGTRKNPWFKPEPNRAYLMSGMLTRGLWLVRRDALPLPSPTPWAEAWRMDLWLKLWEAELEGETVRIPSILSHRRPDAQSAPPQILAEVVEAHLRRVGKIATIQNDAFPLKVSLEAENLPGVALIILTTARRPHLYRCIPAILTKTRCPWLEIYFVVSQTGELDDEQLRYLAPAMADVRVQVLQYPVSEFNFSAANNFAASKTKAPVLCFLNDDVDPITEDWLRTMLGALEDPRVGAVGAKLLYENSKVQHAGVLMGLDGLCGHQFRFLPVHDAGYMHRAALDQELCAVTGACLMVRRDLYEKVGGMDEGFPSAMNDVDLCLKVRAAGKRVVWSAHAVLFHLETVTFGHHYGGTNTPRQLEEARIMRTRWPQETHQDPFHNPNLAQYGGQEWRPAFEPRQDA